MGKVLIEVCIISARGLNRSTSLLKHQWYAVGWIDPNDKYCTNINVSRNDNPIWRTKFATLLEESSLKDSMALQIEVYSREPIFLRERLHGSTSVVLNEFLVKYREGSSRSGTEEVGSYQLRKRNSNNIQGFVDVSIRVSAEMEELNSCPGQGEGFVLSNTNGQTNSGQIYLSGSVNPPYNQHQMSYPPPYHSNPPNLPNPHIPGSIYRPAGRPPPPLPPPLPPAPPSNTGYIPNYLPRTDDYVNLPSSSGGPRALTPGLGFAAGAGVGALAAGSVIFGDDFITGFDMPSGLPDHASLTISADNPF